MFQGYFFIRDQTIIFVFRFLKMNSENTRLKVTFLGTGTSFGVPVIGCNCAVCTSANPKDQRLRSSVLIETKGKTIAIDSGPDFRMQMLREKVTKLDAILLTHSHRDHVGGLDDVRAFNQLTKLPVEVFAKKNTIDDLMVDFAYIFRNNNYPGVPKINFHEVTGVPFFIDDLKIEPIEIMHASLPILGYRIGDFTYITDASYISPESMDKIKGSKIIVLNALRRNPYFSHFNLEQALNVLAELKPEQAYLTHINHQLGLHDETNLELPANVKLGYDGLWFEI